VNSCRLDEYRKFGAALSPEMIEPARQRKPWEETVPVAS
jgi:hypothetical protein